MLPTPPKKMGRPPGSKDTSPRKKSGGGKLGDDFLKATGAVSDDDAAPVGRKSGKTLPSDPKEREEILAAHRVMARPLVAGISLLCEELESKPLNSAEQAAGTDAFAALLWKYMEDASPEGLCALFLLGVGIPRAPEIIRKRRAKKRPLHTEEKVREGVRAADAPPVTASPAH